jgi:peptidyl-prolyl cis-trans isomerase A (cyclophilin A)
MGVVFRRAARSALPLAACLSLVTCLGSRALAGTVVRFTTNLGVFDVDLYDATMPVTVANFLEYVTSDRYASTIFHRSTTYDAFGLQIIQGGGFVLTNNQILPIEADPPIPLEPSTANLRGTIAMARTNQPNSATSQWYFNVTDNPGLDFNYAVFGSVIGTGIDVIDTIGAVPVYNASTQLGPTFSELPLIEPSLSAGNLVLVDNVTIVAPWRVTIDVPSGTQTQAQAGYPTIPAAGSLTKTGAGTVVFDAINAYTGPTTVSAGTLSIANDAAISATAVTIGSGAALAVASGTVLRSPEITLSGGTLNTATIIVDATRGVASLTINSGTVSGAPAIEVSGGGVMRLADTARLTLAASSLVVDKEPGGGLLDLGVGEMTIAPGGTTAASLRVDLVAGRNGGAWNGVTGISSSAAAASGGTRAVGYVVAADGSARVSYAAAGDVDLSGQVNVFDLVAINSAGKYGTGQTANWSQGDFNYDRVTNVFDLVGINTAAVYGQGNYFPTAPAASGGFVAVPEPAGVGLLGIGAGVAGWRLRSRPRAWVSRSGRR